MPDGINNETMSAGNTTIAEIEKNSREIIVVALTEFKGVQFVDLRVNFKTESGDWQPTKKGIAIRPEKLGEVISALQEAKARFEGAAG